MIYENLPQLIVGLDSKDSDSNYIHINDVKEGVTYYCPCCKGVIKPRAYKNDIKYKMQAHFYHKTGGCTEESYVHYICKTWLFEPGSKFIVSGIEYEVENIRVEETLYTSFGNYVPDIIVTTVSKKIFYFEIRTTNKKTDIYIPKWDELGNDVVEVDTKYFINQKCNNNIPEFNLIYSNGECFIKSYSRKDYDDSIAKIKQEWKRQDKINYKIQWERLDWFWCKLQEYILNNSDEECFDDLYNAFYSLEKTDVDFCILTLRKHKRMNDVINKITRKAYNENFIFLQKEEQKKKSQRSLYLSLLLDNKEMIKDKIDELNFLYMKYDLKIILDEKDFYLNTSWIMLRVYYKSYALDRLDLYSKNFNIPFYDKNKTSDIYEIINYINNYYQSFLWKINHNIYYAEWKKILHFFEEKFISKYRLNKNIKVSISKLNWNDETSILFSLLDNNGFWISSQNLVTISPDYKEINVYYGCNKKDFDMFRIHESFDINKVYDVFNLNKNKVLSDYIKFIQNNYGYILIKENTH